MIHYYFLEFRPWLDAELVPLSNQPHSITNVTIFKQECARTGLVPQRARTGSVLHTAFRGDDTKDLGWC